MMVWIAAIQQLPFYLFFLIYLSCSWSQSDGYRHKPLFGIIRHMAKGWAEEHCRRLSLDVLQFDL